MASALSTSASSPSRSYSFSARIISDVCASSQREESWEPGGLDKYTLAIFRVPDVTAVRGFVTLVLTAVTSFVILLPFVVIILPFVVSLLLFVGILLPFVGILLPLVIILLPFVGILLPLVIILLIFVVIIPILLLIKQARVHKERGVHFGFLKVSGLQGRQELPSCMVSAGRDPPP